MAAGLAEGETSGELEGEAGEGREKQKERKPFGLNIKCPRGAGSN